MQFGGIASPATRRHGRRGPLLSKQREKRRLVGALGDVNSNARELMKAGRSRRRDTMSRAGPIGHRGAYQLCGVTARPRRMNQDQVDLVEAAANPVQLARVAFPDVIDGELSDAKFRPQ